MYDAITFFDLDNTLLNNETKVDPEVAQAMDQLRANNVLPVIATGRQLFEIPHVLRDTKIDSIVAGNGAHVMLNEKTIFASIFSEEQILHLRQFAEDQGEAVVMLNDEGYGMDRLTPEMAEAFAYVNSPVPPVIPDYYKGRDIYMMLVLTNDNDAAYLKEFDKDFTFYRNTPHSMDVVLKGISKQTGIKHFLADGHLEGIPTYAFGDGNNDVPMFDLVDHPVAMGNALDRVKEKAEFITTVNVDHGIVNGLKHFDLI